MGVFEPPLLGSEGNMELPIVDGVVMYAGSVLKIPDKHGETRGEVANSGVGGASSLISLRSRFVNRPLSGSVL